MWYVPLYYCCQVKSWYLYGTEHAVYQASSYRKIWYPARHCLISYVCSSGLAPPPPALLHASYIPWCSAAATSSLGWPTWWQHLLHVGNSFLYLLQLLCVSHIILYLPVWNMPMGILPCHERWGLIPYIPGILHGCLGVHVTKRLPLAAAAAVYKKTKL